MWKLEPYCGKKGGYKLSNEHGLYMTAIQITDLKEIESEIKRVLYK